MNKLRELRQERKLSLAKLSKEVNISASLLGYYEREEREPKIETWEKLAKFFNVSPAYLMGLEAYRTDEERQNAFSQLFHVDDILSLMEDPTPFGVSVRGLFIIFSDILLNLNRMADHGRKPEVLTSYLIDVLKLLDDLVINLDLSISDDEKDTISSEISDILRIKREIDQSIDSILILITDNVLDRLPKN